MGDVLVVVEEAEQLGGQVAVGLDPDRATEALVGEQTVGQVELAAGECLGVRSPRATPAGCRGDPGPSRG